MTDCCEQLSLFTLGAAALAVCCMDGAKHRVRSPEPWEKNIIPDGEYAIDWPGCAGVSLVLRPTGKGREAVRRGHEFYHFEISGQIYAGTFTVNAETAEAMTEERGEEE